MEKSRQKKVKVNKGAPSGLIISLVFHAVAFFIAGLFVVFTVVSRPEPAFEAPPPIERPKMSLKKPKVKVRKSSQPKPSSRIVAKVKTKSMPEIQLPDLMGSGEGLLDGVMGGGGLFMDLPDLGEVGFFGGGESSGSDLEVSFYCMARDADGSPNLKLDHPEYFAILRKFVKTWNVGLLSKYYRSPKTLYASTIMIPSVPSVMGPVAFSESMDYAHCWVAYYRGKLVHKDGITIRFWGASDDILTVAVDDKVVLAANYTWDGIDASTVADDWVSHAPDDRKYHLGNQFRAGGDWITLEPGVAHDFKAIAGEGPGGGFHAELLVEVKGVDYPLNDEGAPIFPVFATEPLPRALQDSILMNLAEGEANVTNVTTFFNDL